MSQVATEAQEQWQGSARQTSEYVALLRAGAAQQAGAAARRDNALAIYVPLAGAHVPMGSLFVLAEGTGKLPGSAIAGKGTVESILRSYYSSTLRQPGNRLQSSVSQAGQEIFDQAAARAELLGMGSSVVCAAAVGDRLWVASVGGSRAYLLRTGTGKMELLSDRRTVQEAMTGRPLGADRQVNAHHIGPITLAPGDVLVLCTSSLAERIEGGAAMRLIEAANSTRAGVTGQGLADALLSERDVQLDNGAVIAVACHAVVAPAAAERSGWPRRYAIQTYLPQPGGTTRSTPTPPPAAKATPQPAPAPAPKKEAFDATDEMPRPAAVPDWLNGRPTKPKYEPVAAPAANYRTMPRAQAAMSKGAAPVKMAASSAASAALAASRGAPQWLSYFVVISAIAILSSTGGIVIGLGPQYWLSAAGVAAGVIIGSAALLAVLQFTRRDRPSESVQVSEYHIPRRQIDFEQQQQTPVPTARRLSRVLRATNSRIDYVVAGGSRRTAPTKVDIVDEDGIVVARLALGAPEHLIEPESGKPTGFYVLLYDATSREECAVAWMAPGPHQTEPRPTDPRVLKANWLRGGAAFNINSSTIAAELELLFYRYSDPVTKITLDSVQVGVKHVSRLTQNT